MLKEGAVGEECNSIRRTHDPSSWSVWYLARMRTRRRSPSTVMNSSLVTLLPMKEGFSLSKAEAGMWRTSSGIWYHADSVRVTSRLVLEESVWAWKPVPMVRPDPWT